ncbi:uncharacterized protein [Atheta coriaria]|uniref:uncharacterized protein n=1 Tax=Dalotia coriaria TaxID=877792 RepID=UPI0031F3B1F5
MKLLFLLVCVMVVTIVLASSPLVQVNIGTDTIANALCDDNNNNCQQNQGNGNGGGNTGGTGNTGNTGNTGDSSDSSSEDSSSDDSSSEDSSSDDSDDSGNTGNDSNPDNTGNTGDTGDDTGNTGNTGDNTGNTGNTGDNTGNTGTTGNGTSSAPGGEYSGDTSNYCFLEVEETCSAQQNALYCKSSYGDFDPMAAQFSQMVRNVMRHSYEYLALYIQHSNYLVNRKGFAKLFRELSDYKWNLAKYTISYITERGGVMQFSPPPPPCDYGPVEDSNGGSNGTGTTSSSDPGEYTGNPDGYQLSEILSLAFSNDIEKEVAIAADGLHLIAVGTTGHDVQSAMYLQETYVQPHRMLTTIDQMVALYHFDDLLWSFSVFE